MAGKKDELRRMVIEAISGDYALSRETIVLLRERSEKEIFTLKTVFWIAIGLFNLMVWDILPTKTPNELRWIVGLGALGVALFFPVFGIRRNQGYLHQLSDSPRNPKRARVSEAGRRYMDRVKHQGRHFVRIETEVLEGEMLTD